MAPLSRIVPVVLCRQSAFKVFSCFLRSPALSESEICSPQAYTTPVTVGYAGEMIIALLDTARFKQVRHAHCIQMECTSAYLWIGKPRMRQGMRPSQQEGMPCR